MQNLTDKWIFFIKKAENLNIIPSDVDDEGLRSAYQEANQYTWSQAELDAYDYIDMREEEGRAKLDAAEKRGKAEGVAETEAKAAQEKEMMILTMYEDGISLAKIAKFTQKTEAEVQQIIAAHKHKQ